MERIRPCLWFDNQAEEAAKFYCSIFPNSKMGTVALYGEASAKASGREEGSVMTATFEIEGTEFMGLNGGPIFKINPSISFMFTLKTGDEVEALYEKLVDGGTELMPLAKYPFSEKFVWIVDKFGVSWQLLVGDSPHKIRPTLMFCGPQQGKCEEALKHYTSIFENSKIDFVAKYEDGEFKGQIMHAAFNLNGQGFVAMDSGVAQPFTFNHGVSLMAYCNNQTEIDKLWKDLSDGGAIEECGWLTDKYGVEWQVVPTVLNEIMKDAQKGEKAMAALLTMKKLEIKELELAASK